MVFNQPLEPGALPASLLHLRFGGAYNQPLCGGVLPAGLLTLGLGEGFDQSLTGVFDGRSQLRALCIGEYSSRFSQPIQPSSLPSRLLMLSLVGKACSTGRCCPALYPAR